MDIRLVQFSLEKENLQQHRPLEIDPVLVFEKNPSVKETDTVPEKNPCGE